MNRFAVLFAVALASCAVVLGCSSGERTTTVTNVSRADGGAVTIDPSSPVARGGQGPVTRTTTTTTQSTEPDSVLGATAHAVATIVLLPFRIIGDALGLIV